MRRFILETRDNFVQAALEGDVYFLEEFLIDAIRCYRQQCKSIPEILSDILPLVQKARTAVDTGTGQEGNAPDVDNELAAIGSEFADIDHNALVEAILAVGVDVHEDYKKNRDNRA